MNCAICGRPLDPVMVQHGEVTHPTCPMFADLGNEDPFTTSLKTSLIEMIRWWERQTPRNHQVHIGPSEIGTLCNRRIGYRIAGIEPVNMEFDPWPSIMGTATHSWLQTAVDNWMANSGTTDWMTETTLVINDFIEGHADLYWRKEQTVIDWKTAGPDLFKKYSKEGPPPEYVVQAHIYGYGFESIGLPVKKVALAFLNRAGWLKDMYVWVNDYDRSIAENAIGRVFQIAQQLVSLDILKESNTHRWEDVAHYPSNACGFCLYYDPGRDPERPADHTGCPGR